MRVLVFHGYLLRGTGSNVYNASVAAALRALGHEVHLVCQERRPHELAFVDACGDWDAGSLVVRELRSPARCTVYRPDIGGLLPVYVADRYEGIEARTFPELSEEQVDAYVDANVRAVREVVRRAAPHLALANHLVMGPAVLARALAGTGIPYAVKIHGSALEYTVKPHPRFLPWAREGLAGATGVLVGSRHVGLRLWAAMDDPGLVARTRLGPPGVDLGGFRALEAADARAALAGLARALDTAEPEAAGPAPGAGAPVPTPPPSAFARDRPAAAAAVGRLSRAAAAGDPLVAFVGKLIVSKGPDLLLASWPLVLGTLPQARLAVVGFGGYRAALERMLALLAAGDLEGADALAGQGRGPEGGPVHPLHHLRAFLRGLEGDERAAYVRAAAGLPEHVVVVGRLEHDELSRLLPACAALVVPSTFPEAFGMVAAEAAACGVLPVSAAHSGLAEVSRVLAGAVPEQARELLSFELAGGPVRAIADRITRWLALPATVREAARAALAATARERFGWEGVARGVIAAAQGRLEDLEAPA